MIDFRKLMSEEARKRHADADKYYEKELIKYRNMTSKDLKVSAKYYMTQMQEPWKHEFSCPTYDAVFWHVIIPELLKRLNDNKARGRRRTHD